MFTKIKVQEMGWFPLRAKKFAYVMADNNNNNNNNNNIAYVMADVSIICLIKL